MASISSSEKLWINAEVGISVWYLWTYEVYCTYNDTQHQQQQQHIGGTIKWH